MASEKYPRTHHLPWSPGGTSDDKRCNDIAHFVGRALVITEKMDGSNVCLEHDAVYARSHVAAPKHPSFDALKALHARVRFSIPVHTRVFAEWMYARHSIAYTALPGYLLVLGVHDTSTRTWLSWDDTCRIAERLEITTVPVLAHIHSDSVWSPAPIPTASRYGGACEGYVVRLAGSFTDTDFSRSIAKCVRAGHVQTDDHWSHQSVVRNGLAPRSPR